MILITAYSRFQEDISRAKKLVEHARLSASGSVKDDILRAAWMTGVGESDAYFCEAYIDLVTRTLRAKDKEPAIELPKRLGDLRVPVTAVIREAEGWRWRMAAREMMERESVLSINQIKDLFNHFFRNQTKILRPDTIEPWIVHRQSKQRLWGISKKQYLALPDASAKRAARSQAMDKFNSRMAEIFQRRHDCIHTCDRPRQAVQQTSLVSTEKSVADIEFLVTRCHEEFKTEFLEYLKDCGFSVATRNAVTR